MSSGSGAGGAGSDNPGLSSSTASGASTQTSTSGDPASGTLAGPGANSSGNPAGIGGTGSISDTSVVATSTDAGGAGNTVSAASVGTTGGPLGGGEVTVSGRQILVRGEPIHLRGVNWNPVPVGGTHPQDLAYADFAALDIPLMQAAGINAVRTYEPLTDAAVLDALAAAGIFVLNTVYGYGGDDVSVLDERVNAVKDHPATLLYVVGNEWNYNGMYVGLSEPESITRINAVVERIRTLDPNHPIATIYGELPSAAVLEELSEIDAWGLNVYSGISFGERFGQWQSLSGKPMFFGEYGADAYNATTQQYDPDSQATATLELTREILQNKSAAGGVCVGGMIFEFADEWWKDPNGSLNEQDVGGIAPGGGPYPDSTFNEEYWGIVSIDRVPRPAYQALKELYAP